MDTTLSFCPRILVVKANINSKIFAKWPLMRRVPYWRWSCNRSVILHGYNHFLWRTIFRPRYFSYLLLLAFWQTSLQRWLQTVRTAARSLSSIWIDRHIVYPRGLLIHTLKACGTGILSSPHLALHHLWPFFPPNNNRNQDVPKARLTITPLRTSRGATDTVTILNNAPDSLTRPVYVTCPASAWLWLSHEPSLESKRPLALNDIGLAPWNIEQTSKLIGSS